MLVRPAPLPDELDRSYLGRFMRLNGKSNEKEALALAATWSSDYEKSGKGLTKVELLSQISGLHVRRFVCEHTTMPLRRSIAPSHNDVPHGDPTHPFLLRGVALRTARPGAYYCQECACQDLEFYGTCYWHRSHQIPGQYWCPKHGSPLFFLDDERAFLSPPSAHYKFANQVDGKWVSALQAKKAHQRFLSTAEALMKRDVPLKSWRIAHSLLKRAHVNGFLFGHDENASELFREAILGAFDETWLRAVIPVVRNKCVTDRSWSEGLFASDRLGRRTPINYILSASLLCDSAEAAMATFTAASDRRTRGLRHHDLVILRLDAAYLRYGGFRKAIIEKPMGLPHEYMFSAEKQCLLPP